MVQCDKCKKWYHQFDCFGPLIVPEDDWFCHECDRTSLDNNLLNVKNLQLDMVSYTNRLHQENISLQEITLNNNNKLVKNNKIMMMENLKMSEMYKYQGKLWQLKTENVEHVNDINVMKKEIAQLKQFKSLILNGDLEKYTELFDTFSQSKSFSTLKDDLKVLSMIKDVPEMYNHFLTMEPGTMKEFWEYRYKAKAQNEEITKLKAKLDTVKERIMLSFGDSFEI